MASGLTNIGKKRILEMAFRDTQDSAAMDTAPLYLALSTSAASLDAETTTFDTATEIAPGNGYTTGGEVVERDGADLTVWDVLDINAASAYGYIRLKDMVWTATGTFPASGNGAFYAVLLDDNATVGSRQVYGWVDLTTARSIGSGATLTLQDIEIRLT